MPQDALHYYFIVYLEQEVIREARVKNFFNRNRGPIEEALVNDREAPLRDLLAYLNFI
jgi:hypothetical protein